MMAEVSAAIVGRFPNVQVFLRDWKLEFAVLFAELALRLNRRRSINQLQAFFTPAPAPPVEPIPRVRRCRRREASLDCAVVTDVHRVR